MQVDTALINRLALLSKLSFNDGEAQQLIVDMSNILDLVDKLNEIDTEGVEPLIYLNSEINVLRDDVIIPLVSKADVLKNAPNKDSDYIKVPKVIQ